MGPHQRCVDPSILLTPIMHVLRAHEKPAVSPLEGEGGP